MIPHMTIFMLLHSSDSLYFLLSLQHNVSAAVSPWSSPPLIPLPLFNSPPAHLHILIAHSVLSSITLSPLFPPLILHPLVASALVCLHSFIVPGSEIQLPPLFLHAWCIILTRIPFLQLSFITPVLSAFLANSPPIVTLRFSLYLIIDNYSWF